MNGARRCVRDGRIDGLGQAEASREAVGRPAQAVQHDHERVATGRVDVRRQVDEARAPEPRDGDAGDAALPDAAAIGAAHDLGEVRRYDERRGGHRRASLRRLQGGGQVVRERGVLDGRCLQHDAARRRVGRRDRSLRPRLQPPQRACRRCVGHDGDEGRDRRVPDEPVAGRGQADPPGDRSRGRARRHDVDDAQVAVTMSRLRLVDRGASHAGNRAGEQDPAAHPVRDRQELRQGRRLTRRRPVGCCDSQCRARDHDDRSGERDAGAAHGSHRVAPATLRQRRSGPAPVDPESFDRRSTDSLRACGSARLAAAVAVVAASITVVGALHASGSSAAFAPVRVASPIVGPPASIAALGDSFNTGFDAGPVRGDAPSLSWSTGDDAKVDSLYLRLQEVVPRRAPLPDRARRLQDRRPRAPDGDRCRSRRAAHHRAVGWQRHLQREGSRPRDVARRLPRRVHAGDRDHAAAPAERAPAAHEHHRRGPLERRLGADPGQRQEALGRHGLRSEARQRREPGPEPARRDPGPRADATTRSSARSAQPIRTAAGTAARSSGSRTRLPTSRPSTPSTRRSRA